MSELNLDTITIESAARALRERSISAVELTEAVLQRARNSEKDVNAYAYLCPEIALAAARKADELIRSERFLGPCHGIPIGVKDLISTFDMPTEAGSELFKGHMALRDARIVKCLRDSGAIILGKHRTHEFGFGMNEPITRSAWAPEYYAGGSTVGGAVSVSVGSSLAAIGTDGAGSIRKPAAINGLVGLKPTYKLLDNEGVFPGAGSFTHLGWITRSVYDAQLIFSVTTNQPVPPRLDDIKGLRVGCPSYFFKDIQADIGKLVKRCLDIFADAGAVIVEFDIPELYRSASIHHMLGLYEAYGGHKRWIEESPMLYHPDSLKFLKGGADVGSELAETMRTERAGMLHLIDAVFDTHGIDVICSPTLALSPVKMVDMVPERHLAAYTRLTVPFNVSGQPAISIPCGLDDLGIPVGCQLATRSHTDSRLLEIASFLEARLGWKPPAFAY
ncbi:amidase [uncultured Castellaniella sp.]|uniref:amidase n=1 Tax=uncultured Castellaniella sp. TaxID=647907 RepID=UPI00262C45ED|nr:amidase [uncultured Castellaniella sp.]